MYCIIWNEHKLLMALKQYQTRFNTKNSALIVTVLERVGYVDHLVRGRLQSFTEGMARNLRLGA